MVCEKSHIRLVSGGRVSDGPADYNLGGRLAKTEPFFFLPGGGGGGWTSGVLCGGDGVTDFLSASVSGCLI